MISASDSPVKRTSHVRPIGHSGAEGLIFVLTRGG
jgi:hypothetical protein